MMVSPTKHIYCCECARSVVARLTDGEEIYPHRPDLGGLPFWICDECKNYVGCHHKSSNRTHPLGNIPTPEIREARKQIHRILDPLWKGIFGLPVKDRRRELYAKISARIGHEFHSGEIKSMEEAQVVLAIVKELAA